jgi:DNA polymerase elongation subunit (family B)
MKFNIDKILFFDIETVSQYETLDEMPKPKLKVWDSYRESFKKKVTDESKLVIVKTVEDTKKNIKEIYRQTAAFYPEFGKVVCISMGFVTKKGDIKYETFNGEDELEILTEFRKVLNKIKSMGFELCGHSIKNFDLPFLSKRFFIHGLKLPSIFPTYDTKPWDMKVIDTKDIWTMGNSWSIGSLDLVCDSLEIESPKNGDISGDNIGEKFWAGNHDEIKDYCQRDVKAVIDMITKLNDLK